MYRVPESVTKFLATLILRVYRHEITVVVGVPTPISACLMDFASKNFRDVAGLETQSLCRLSLRGVRAALLVYYNP
jgi:hypothetical protein